jgi:hypothetical protein
MREIFLSYRREDAPGYAGRLADSLERAFGADSVFRDVDSIGAGASWQQDLTRAIHRSKVLIAVIGPTWQDLLLSESDDQADWVRFELKTAWDRGIPIIPVTVGKAAIDHSRDLKDLGWLPSLQVLDLSDVQHRWHSDLSRLVQAIALSTGLTYTDSVAPNLSTPVADYGTRLGNFFDDYLGTRERPIPFGGRSSEMESLDAWLADPSAPNFMLVAGPAGRGKSALLTRWSAMVERREDDLDVVVIPINIRFRTNLATVVFPTAVLRLAALHGNSIQHASIPSAEVWRAMLGDYLMKPLPGNRKLLVVFDGLDEADGWEAGPDLFPARLPSSTKLLVSARYLRGHNDSSGWLRKLGWDVDGWAATLDLQPLSVGGVADVLRQMSFPLDRLAASVDVVGELYRLSEGDPLLIRFYVDDLWAKQGEFARLNPESLRELSPGLGNYLGKWLKDQYDVLIAEIGEDPQALFEVVLNVFSCARGPLLKKDLHAILPEGIGSRLLALERVLKTLSRFVIGDGKQQGYIFSHPRLADYHRDELHEAGLLAEQEAVFVTWGSSVLDAVAQGRMEVSEMPHYVIQYYRVHLDQYYRVHLERVGAPVEKYVELLSDTWFQAWNQVEKGSYSGFLNDVEWVWREVRVANKDAAAGGESVPFLGTEFRCAICRSSINSLAREVPACLIAELINRGIWSIAHATVFARHIPSREAAAQLLVEVDTLTVHSQSQILLMAALEIIGGIAEESIAERLYGRIGSALAGELVDMAFNQARKVSPSASTPLLIRSLAQLDGSEKQARLIEILRIADALDEGDPKRTRILAGVVAQVDLNELLDAFALHGISLPGAVDGDQGTSVLNRVESLVRWGSASEEGRTQLLLAVLERRRVTTTEDEWGALLNALPLRERIEGVARVLESGSPGRESSIWYALAALNRLHDPEEAFESVARLNAALAHAGPGLEEIKEYLAYARSYACARLVSRDGGKWLEEFERSCAALDSDDAVAAWQIAIDGIFRRPPASRAAVLVEAASRAPAGSLRSSVIPASFGCSLVERISILCTVQRLLPDEDLSEAFLDLVDAAREDEHVGPGALTVIAAHVRGPAQTPLRDEAVIAGLIQALKNSPPETVLMLLSPLIPLFPQAFSKSLRDSVREASKSSESSLYVLGKIYEHYGDTDYMDEIDRFAKDTTASLEQVNKLLDTLDLLPSQHRLETVERIREKITHLDPVERADWLLQNAFRFPVEEALPRRVLSSYRLDLVRELLTGTRRQRDTAQRLRDTVARLAERVGAEFGRVALPEDLEDLFGMLDELDYARIKNLLLPALSSLVDPGDRALIESRLQALPEASQAECRALLAIPLCGATDTGRLSEALDALRAISSVGERASVFERIAGHAGPSVMIPEVIGSTLGALHSIGDPKLRLKLSRWLLPNLKDTQQRTEAVMLAELARETEDLALRCRLLTEAQRYLGEPELASEALRSHLLWVLSRNLLSIGERLKLQLLLATAEDDLYDRLMAEIIDSAPTLENTPLGLSMIETLLGPLKRSDVEKFLISALDSGVGPATDLIDYAIESRLLTQAMIEPFLAVLFRQPESTRRSWLGRVAEGLVAVDPDLLSTASRLAPLNALELIVACYPRVSGVLQGRLLAEALGLARKADLGAQEVRKMIDAALQLEERPTSLMAELVTTLGRLSDHGTRDQLLGIAIPKLDDAQLVKLLSMITEINDGTERASAVLRIGALAEDPEVVRTCAQGALRQANAISSSATRAGVLVSILVHLDVVEGQALYLEALSLLQEVSDEEARWRVLSELMTQLRWLDEEVITQVVAVTGTIETPHWRAGLIKQMVGYLPGSLLSNVLAYLEELREESIRRDLLLTLADYLPARWHDEALRIVLALGDEVARGRALVALAPVLTGRLRRDALYAVRNIGSPEVRAEMLLGMVPWLDEGQRGWVFEEVASAVGRIEEEMVRAQVLCGLIPRLPAAQLDGMLDLAARFRNESHRARTLAEIVLFLPESGLHRVMGVLDGLVDEQQRLRVIRRLAPLMPSSLLEEAYRAVRGIDEPRDRALALRRLSGRFPASRRETVMDEALVAVRQIEDQPKRVAVLIDLAAELSVSQRSEGLAIIEGLQNDAAVVRALVGMASAAVLEEGEIERLLVIVERIAAEEHRIAAITGLARHLPASCFGAVLVLVRALPIAGRLTALKSLAAQLPVERLPEMLALTRSLGAGYARAEVLCRLVRQLPESERHAVAAEALEAASSILDEEHRSQILVDLESLLVDSSRGRWLEAATWIDDPVFRVEVYCAVSKPFSRQLEPSFLAHVRELEAPEHAAFTLFRYARNLTEPEAAPVLAEGLDRLESTLSLHDRLDILVAGIQGFGAAPPVLVDTLYDWLWAANNGHLIFAKLKAVAAHIPGRCCRDAAGLLDAVEDDAERSQLLEVMLARTPSDCFDYLLSAVRHLECHSTKARLAELAAESAPPNSQNLVHSLAIALRNASARRPVLAALDGCGAGAELGGSLVTDRPPRSTLSAGPDACELERLLASLLALPPSPASSAGRGPDQDALRVELVRVAAGAEGSRARVEGPVLDGDLLLRRLEAAEFDAEKLALIDGLEGELTDTQGREVLSRALDIRSTPMRLRAVLRVAPRIPEASWLEPWLDAACDSDEYARATALKMIELSFRAPDRLAVYKRWSRLIGCASRGRRTELLSTMTNMVPVVRQLAGSEQDLVEDIAEAGEWWP